MLLNLAGLAILLSTFYIAQSYSLLPTGYCECETTFSSSAASDCAKPPPPSPCGANYIIGDLSDEEYDEFCNSGCFHDFLQCLMSSNNENCTSVAKLYPQVLCANATDSNETCWTIFAQTINCTLPDPCNSVRKSGTCDDSECKNNLRMFSDAFGCCTELFTEYPFTEIASTTASVYDTCGISLNECSPASPSPSPTPNGALHPQSVSTAVVELMVVIAAYF